MDGVLVVGEVVGEGEGEVELEVEVGGVRDDEDGGDAGPGLVVMGKMVDDAEG